MPVPKVKVRKKPQNKRCEKGFPCKTTCISRTKNCKAPLKWQAKTFLLWEKAQQERLALTNKKRERAGLTPAQLNDSKYITAERTKLPQSAIAKVETAIAHNEDDKQIWQMTRSELFENPDIVRSYAKTQDQYLVKFTYLNPGPAGPFRGSEVMAEKPKKGSTLYGGTLRVESVSRAKPVKLDTEQLYNLGKEIHRKAVESALLDGKLVPDTVLKDYPDLISKPTKSVSQKEDNAIAALEDLAKIRVDDTPKTTGGNSDRATNRLLNDLHQKAFEIKNAEATLLKMQKANDSIKARADKGSTTPPAFSSSEINKQKKLIKTAEDQYRALEVELQNSTHPIPQKRESRFKIPQSQAMRSRKPFERYRPNQVADVPISILNFDPKRFQYKLVHGETGSSGSLTGVGKWNPNLAGVVQVWKDPSDNKIYVVNGHNRASLAKKLGVEKITVRFLDVPIAAAARATGALTNIAEGRGNALDAGKFFRDSGLSRQDLAKEGIPMKEAIAVQGLALATLPEHLFARVVLGEMSVARAAELGCCGLSHHQMDSLSQLIEQSEKKGKIITNAAIAELVETVKSSDTQKVEIFDLFGNSAQDQSLAIEKASLQSKMKSRLSREKKLFGTVGKTKAAKELERGGNQINKEESAKIAEEADIGLRIFDQLKNVSSPISDLLNEAARRITNGESRSKTEDEIYSRIVAVLPTLNVGGKSFGSNGTKEGDGAIDDQPTLFSEYRHYTSDTRRTISQG